MSFQSHSSGSRSRRKTYIAALAAMLLLPVSYLCSISFAVASPSHQDQSVVARIAWYGTLKSGLQEAERTNKPILLVSAAPQCVGVPGIW